MASINACKAQSARMQLPYLDSPAKLSSEVIAIILMFEHPFINLDKVDDNFLF